jgi:hypothetical protein
MNIETWTPITDFPNYAVSDCGNVKRLTDARGTAAGVVLQGDLDKYGYRVVLLRNQHLRKTVKIHRLVAAAFIKPIPKDMQINHKNGVKLDNRVENLEIVTAGQNVRHSFRNLGRKTSSGYGATHLSDEQVLQIRRLKSEGVRQNEIAHRFDLSVGRVSAIILRKSYKDVI